MIGLIDCKKLEKLAYSSAIVNHTIRLADFSKFYCYDNA